MRFHSQQYISQICRFFSPHDERADTVQGATLELSADRSSSDTNRWTTPPLQSQCADLFQPKLAILSLGNFSLWQWCVNTYLVVCKNLCSSTKYIRISNRSIFYTSIKLLQRNSAQGVACTPYRYFDACQKDLAQKQYAQCELF